MDTKDLENSAAGEDSQEIQTNQSGDVENKNAEKDKKEEPDKEKEIIKEEPSGTKESSPKTEEEASVPEKKSETETKKDDDKKNVKASDSVKPNPDAKEEDAQDKDAESQEEKQEAVEIEKIDYSKLERENLIAELTRLLDTQPVNKIRDEVEAIKAHFYKKQKAVNEKKRKEFINEGGDLDNFELPEDGVENEFKNLIKRYRRLKAAFNRELEKDKDKNLEAKYEVIEELKKLVLKDESIGDTFREFRTLQDRWREIGQVPQPKLKDLWNTYHHHVEKFYDYIKINKELRDLDLKKNLEKKTQLCEKAEALLDEPSVVKAFKTLQKFHASWREIGPVPNDQKEPLWQRFKEATRQINKRHQDYFKNLKEQQKENLERKTKLCEQAEELSELDIATHKEWNEKTKAIIDLQKVWRTIGFAPKKDNNAIYARFRNACDKFFNKKRDFYVQNKEFQENNLKLKTEICEKAEEIMDSEDWKKTTRDLINLQKEWKEIGPVPRKQSDKIWKRFRAACDHFFNRKSEHYSHIDEEYEKNLKLKQDLIDRVKSYEFVEDTSENFEALKNFQEEWASIGFVPYEMKDKIQNQFRDAINEQFDKLKVADSEKKLLKYRTKLENIQHKPKANSKMRHERDKFIGKIKKLENNIKLWENNLGFISPESKTANAMIQDFEKKINEAKNEIEVLEEKIRMIDKTEDE